MRTMGIISGRGSLGRGRSGASLLRHGAWGNPSPPAGRVGNGVSGLYRWWIGTGISVGPVLTGGVAQPRTRTGVGGRSTTGASAGARTCWGSGGFGPSSWSRARFALRRSASSLPRMSSVSSACRASSYRSPIVAASRILSVLNRTSSSISMFPRSISGATSSNSLRLRSIWTWGSPPSSSQPRPPSASRAFSTCRRSSWRFIAVRRISLVCCLCRASWTALLAANAALNRTRSLSFRGSTGSAGGNTGRNGSYGAAYGGGCAWPGGSRPPA